MVAHRPGINRFSQHNGVRQEDDKRRFWETQPACARIIGDADGKSISVFPFICPSPAKPNEGFTFPRMSLSHSPSFTEVSARSLQPIVLRIYFVPTALISRRNARQKREKTGQTSRDSLRASASPARIRREPLLGTSVFFENHPLASLLEVRQTQIRYRRARCGSMTGKLWPRLRNNTA